MKLHRIAVQIYAPKDDYVGQVEEGTYSVENGEVSLTNSAGVPFLDKRGKPYSKKLKDTESAHVIAGRLLKQRWQDRAGDKRKFSAPINYPKLVY